VPLRLYLDLTEDNFADLCSRGRNPRLESRDIRCWESRRRRSLRFADPVDLETQTVVRCIYGGILSNLTANTPSAAGCP